MENKELLSEEQKAYVQTNEGYVVLTTEDIIITDSVALDADALYKLFLYSLKLPKGNKAGDFLRNLIDRENKLSYLEAGGVDNWEWYGESLKDYWEEEE